MLSLFSFAAIHSQVINIEDKDGTRLNGAYYKDVNNHLNQFEGTYKYTSGGEELTLVLKKFVNNFNSVYYQDLLAGEFKYVMNGVTIFDNLNKINQNLPNKFLHDVSGNSVINPSVRPVCEDCTTNQKRAELVFFGRNNNTRGGSIILQKIIENGQPEKLRIRIFYNDFIQIEGEQERLDSVILSSEYILVKQF